MKAQDLSEKQMNSHSKDMANLPPIAPYPPASVRNGLSKQEWNSILDVWITLTDLHLRLPDDQSTQKSAKDDSLVSFLVSYLAETYSTLKNEHQGDLKIKRLRRNVFLLSHRLLSKVGPPPGSLLRWTILGHLSVVYAGNQALTALLSAVWKENGSGIAQQLSEPKSQLLRIMESPNHGNNDELDRLVSLLSSLIQACPESSETFFAGSEILDAICSGYGSLPHRVQKGLLRFSYLGLTSLKNQEKPHVSVLLDHLYSLKSAAEKFGMQAPFLTDLVSQTPLLADLHELAQDPKNGRVLPLVHSLRSYQSAPHPNHHQSKRHGKQPVRKSHEDAAATQEMHVHRMSLISQVQDLFPDLGSGFVVRLLDEYNDDVEVVTAHLLDDSLPAHLREADRNEELFVSLHCYGLFVHSLTPTSHNAHHHDAHQIPHDLAPHPTPPPIPTRRNVFDNDELDRLAVDTSRLHLGRRNATESADALLNDRSTAPNKAAILSALAAFDSDDDERDDTYDVADVGGAVDVAAVGPPDEANGSSSNEEALFSAYKLSPEVYSRDAATRRSPARATLKAETQMTDEAIEGWAVMLGRDPRALRRLEERYSGFQGNQIHLEPTAWRAGSDAEDGGRGGGGFRGSGGRGANRGRPRAGGIGRGRGRGEATAGGSGSDRDTQMARDRKETNKASRANHNRRDQRAKKVARGMAG